MKYALLLNDMRTNTENIDIVRIDENRDALIAWYNEQKADETWIDGGHWHKVFKKGSEIEWRNPHDNLDEDNNYWGGIWQVDDSAAVGAGLSKAGGSFWNGV